MLLYIHIPFCDSKCSYCAFNSYVDKFSLRKKYMDALLVQLEHELERFGTTPQNPIETVFIGGGTPSTVDAALYVPLFEKIAPFLGEGCEITSEANPNSDTPEWLEGMKRVGVNRVSFGVQSFDDAKLTALGRAHNSAQALNAVRNAAQIGFERLSLDLIYGVAGDTRPLLERDVSTAFSLPIDHISLYALTIEEATAFEKTPEKAHEELDLTRWLFKEIADRGFEQYEISNFGRTPSRHNLGYWEHKPYIGLGSGAVGFLRNRRFYPPNDIQTYIADPLAAHVEELTPGDLLSEKLFLGLRSKIGVDAGILNAAQRKEADILLRAGLLEERGGRLYNTDFLLADEIALRIEGF